MQFKEGTAFFSNYDDARIYMHPRGSEPYPISAPPEGERSVRYADFDISPNGGTLFCVMESHPLDGGEVINSIASLSTDGVGALSVLLSGHDFYAAPRISPNGQRVAWLQWDHPDMPWDAAELWVGTLCEEGVKDAKRIAGGEGESIAQPEWSPDGVLHFVSDRTGWWNLYTFENGSVSTLIQMEAEFAEPAWVFGMSPLWLPFGWLYNLRTYYGGKKSTPRDCKSGKILSSRCPVYRDFLLAMRRRYSIFHRRRI